MVTKTLRLACPGFYAFQTPTFGLTNGFSSKNIRSDWSKELRALVSTFSLREDSQEHHSRRPQRQDMLLGASLQLSFRRRLTTGRPSPSRASQNAFEPWCKLCGVLCVVVCCVCCVCCVCGASSRRKMGAKNGGQNIQEMFASKKKKKQKSNTTMAIQCAKK